MVKIHVHSYDDGSDIFNIVAFGFTEEDQEADPDYCKGAPDFDDFEVPGILLPFLIGEHGEPADLVGRVFTVKQ